MTDYTITTNLCLKKNESVTKEELEKVIEESGIDVSEKDINEGLHEAYNKSGEEFINDLEEDFDTSNSKIKIEHLEASLNGDTFFSYSNKRNLLDEINEIDIEKYATIEPHYTDLKDDILELDTKRIIITLLLIHKKRKLLYSDKAKMSPMDIKNATQISLDELYPIMRQLEQDSFLANHHGEYKIPDNKVHDAVKLLKK